MNEFKQALLDAGKKMLNTGLTIETWGNLSLRDHATERIFITPSGMPYEELSPDDIVVLNLAGDVAEGIRKPSVETDLHCLIYKNRPDVNAILHTHPVSSCVFAVLRKNIPVITDELAQAIGGEVVCADYALPGTAELAKNALSALGEKGACLLSNHGAICVGKNFAECFKVAAVLESSAEIYMKALALGTPAEISPENVKRLRDFARYKYGQGR